MKTLKQLKPKSKSLVHCHMLFGKVIFKLSGRDSVMREMTLFKKCQIKPLYFLYMRHSF
jgi:hypothetical protein